MKKILLPLLLSLLATSCLKDSTLYVEDFSDFATVYEGKLVTDQAYRLTVVENKTENETWKVEGKRYFIVCDILNRNLEVRLKDILVVDLKDALPYTEEENEPDDPVEVMDQAISGGYINMSLAYYADPDSNAAHVFSLYYVEDKVTNHITLHLLHEGDDENPVYMETKYLEKRSKLISVPLWNLLERGKAYTLELCLYELKKADDNTYSIEQNTYPLHRGTFVL